MRKQRTFTAEFKAARFQDALSGVVAPAEICRLHHKKFKPNRSIKNMILCPVFGVQYTILKVALGIRRIVLV